MNISRKKFLQLSGVSFVVVVAGKGLSAFTEQESGSGGAAPDSGRRWAMAIDIRKCLEKKDCTKCLQACNEAHNVPSDLDPLHEVKWIWKAQFENAFSSGQNSEYLTAEFQNAELPVFCNHCEQPPCVRVCPTQATWKREDGIVMMDWHRCIGCRYCMAACPYGSRSFNWIDPRPHLARLNPDFPTRTKGVVEKCNLCEERLAKGEVPACVEACPQKAMIFGDINAVDSPVKQLLRSNFSIQRKPELGTKPQVFYIV
jgi:Fe-S-cluster-containing dehydrogenase component